MADQRPAARPIALRAGAAGSALSRFGRRGLGMLRRTPFPRPTLRGWTVLAVGIGLVGGGLVASMSVAVSAGLLLLVLVVAGVVTALAVAAPLRASRSAPRATVQVGEVYRERVTLRGSGVRFAPRSTLLVREQLDDLFVSTGDAASLVTIGPGQPPAVLDVEALAIHRGRATIGPVTIRVEDPFGLLRIDRPVVPAEEVVVVPGTTPLAALDTGALAGAVSADEGRVGQGGSADDSELRPYRPGDPIRRVHWGQSAKRGVLHVRQTTQAQPPGGRGRPRRAPLLVPAARPRRPVRAVRPRRRPGVRARGRGGGERRPGAVGTDVPGRTRQ
ncbi:DUF58 domain-containing protein [Curtobacterium sp. MCPF17_052]|uniref:DUF58 domain-containing protein n=1 Tax=Curtobacterium sp. MCPF17_052 TaxID=2175655 RepID=UPI0024E00287|nr:DUF58 domain-containing protein [Curtobacterium sp. MCPF17_052]WIB13300.1 DUF58 domain-containing protein [Curtobacterium sp. MCPF17_052]